MKTPRTDFKTIDEYIAGFPEDVRRKLSEVRSTVKKAAPDATEKISYRMPGFDYNGSLVWFAAFKNHIGFYPTSSGISEFEDELKKYKDLYGDGASEITSIEALEELVNYFFDHERFEEALKMVERLLTFVPYSADAWQREPLTRGNQQEAR